MSENNITEQTIQRLSFIKYLFDVAVEQSRLPEPLSAASVLTFHDSIELFLQLACEHLSVNVKNDITFLEYWEMLKPKLSGEGLTQKSAMSRLNASRGNLKHKGLLPHKKDIEGFRANSMNFFIDNTPLVFGIDFENISMINLVPYEATRARLKQAEYHKENGNIEKALIEIAYAFYQLIDDYKARNHFYFGRSPFLFGDDTSSGSIRILSLGLDYRRYIRFQQLVPEVFKNANGMYDYSIIKVEKPSIEDYKFCFDFVIHSAIHLGEFDFENKN